MEIEQTSTWRKAFAAASRLNLVGSRTKSAMLENWQDHGDSIRSAVADDLILASALRVLLPAYFGSSMRLYRGDIWQSRRRRTYGFSWSASEEVAESFALGTLRTCEGGSVLLAADVPTEAIICSLKLLEDRYAEAEYLVDRRRLGRVWVIRRFPQITSSSRRNR